MRLTKRPYKKHITFRFEWDLERLPPSKYEKNGEIAFKYMDTEMYEQYLTFSWDYQIVQSLTVNMKTARTVEPAYILLGGDMPEETEHNFHVPLVHGTIITGFTPKQTHNPHLKRVIEQEITCTFLEEFG
jgi:hypothetical protein